MNITSPPLDPVAIREMYDLWKLAFGPDIEPDISFELLAGSEMNENNFRVYSEIVNDQIAATAIVVSPLDLPELGALGEVATHPEFRQRGLASGLCRQLLDDFREQGGEAMFLGTVNPRAASIYERFGWNHIPNTKLMVHLTGQADPEEYLGNYFSGLIPLEVRTAGAKSRIPIIPLIISPHDWSVLDANVSMFSTRTERQVSCLGLYNRYNSLRETEQGEWFTLVTKEGKNLGISSAAQTGESSYQIDGFCHVSCPDYFQELIQTAIRWCSGNGASEITMKLSIDDEGKTTLIRSMGFQKSQSDGSFQYGEKTVNAVTYSLS
jgi:GNAT superfamily N-acetyltransferase